MKDYCKDFTFGEFYIPKYMESGINLYISEGIKGGSFLNAIVSNDLKSAVMCADHENINNIPAYVAFFYIVAPMGCSGSPERFKNWVKMGGLNGIANKGTGRGTSEEG